MMIPPINDLTSLNINPEGEDAEGKDAHMLASESDSAVVLDDTGVDARGVYTWQAAPVGTHTQVVGPKPTWKKVHFILGETIVTVSIGFLTRHEARATKALRDAATWRQIPIGPYIIALSAEIN